MGQAPQKHFQVTRGKESLSLYRWNTGEAQHYFCKHCGIYTHHVMRGATDYVGINMACVEGFDVYAIEEVLVGGGAKLSLLPRALPVDKGVPVFYKPPNLAQPE
jgi:hypothetical protein